jgi:hypothetical protein
MMCPWPEKIWQDLPSKITNFYCFNTVLHEGTLQGRQTTGKFEMLLPLSSNVTSFVRWRISLFNDASSHLWTESNKPLIITHHQDWVDTLSFPSLQHSCIKQNWTVQHNFQIRCGVTCPPNVLSTSLHSKQTKILQTIQCVPINSASFWWGSGPLCLIQVSHCYD